MGNMLDAENLARLSVTDRRKLLGALVALEEDAAPAPGSSWRWDAILVFIVGSCIVLAAWIGVLAVTLPRFYHTGNWRGAWVGFDVALLGMFAVTGWAAWRRRQLLIICLVAIFMARRLLRLTIGRVMRYEGLTGPVPPLWRIPLLGPAAGTPLERLIKARAEHRARAAAACQSAAEPPPGAEPSVPQHQSAAGPAEDDPPAA
jgi:hypothetical protein